ncbi:MAG: putative glycoside hydrolase [Patescibacteria group bacterium]|jgi:hypothetical protein
MKKILIILLVVVYSLPIFSQKILKANYWTSPKMSETVAKSLAGNDLIIVDVDNWKNNRENLQLLKKLNPNILLIIYTNLLEVFPNAGINRPWQQALANEIYTKFPVWLLKTDRRNEAVFTPKMRMLNVSSTCPKINGQTYTDWYADKLTNGILRDSLVDGYFCDNGSGKWAWLYSGKGEQIDADNDGQPDLDYILDNNMSEGVKSFLHKIRQVMGKKFILIANKGSVEYMDDLDGRMFEDWRNDYLGDDYDGGWWQCLINGRKTGDYTIIKIKSAKDLDFAYLSAKLLGHNVYVAIGQDNSNPYPEFPTDLGKLEKIEIRGYFEKGIINITPSKSNAEIQKKDR